MKVKFEQLFRWPLCVGESVPHRHVLPPLARALQWKGTASAHFDALVYTSVGLGSSIVASKASSCTLAKPRPVRAKGGDWFT